MSNKINPLINISNMSESKDGESNLVSPDDLVKVNRELNEKLYLKVNEVKELFINYKLNEEDNSYQRSYELSTHELSDIKKQKADLNNEIVLMNNILNLKLHNVDSDLNMALRKTNKLKTRIDDENNQINSFEQMKDDEIIEYRLNIYYIIGLFIGGGFLVKQMLNYSIKK